MIEDFQNDFITSVYCVSKKDWQDSFDKKVKLLKGYKFHFSTFSKKDFNYFPYIIMYIIYFFLMFVILYFSLSSLVDALTILLVSFVIVIFIIANRFYFDANCEVFLRQFLINQMIISQKKQYKLLFRKNAVIERKLQFTSDGIYLDTNSNLVLALKYEDIFEVYFYDNTYYFLAKYNFKKIVILNDFAIKNTSELNKSIIKHVLQHASVNTIEVSDEEIITRPKKINHTNYGIQDATDYRYIKNRNAKSKKDRFKIVQVIILSFIISLLILFSFARISNNVWNLKYDEYIFIAYIIMSFFSSLIYVLEEKKVHNHKNWFLDILKIIAFFPLMIYASAFYLIYNICKMFSVEKEYIEIDSRPLLKRIFYLKREDQLFFIKIVVGCVLLFILSLIIIEVEGSSKITLLEKIMFLYLWIITWISLIFSSRLFINNNINFLLSLFFSFLFFPFISLVVFICFIPYFIYTLIRFISKSET